MIMSLDTIKNEKFGIARGNEVLVPLYGTEGEARQQLAHVSDTMRGIGLEPDVDLVTVTETISYGKPKPYKEPEPEQPADEQTTDGDAGEGQPAA